MERTFSNRGAFYRKGVKISRLIGRRTSFGETNYKENN
uniref:Uncharacterized protein n=1 Tax=Siphoviridae sp. cttJO12 TaxID=2826492 RepID=A0A8S5R1C8_9CAUD|nr:MAG TPA: hypothetical protein [Siphoviridae sp. cttJO12]